MKWELGGRVYCNIVDGPWGCTGPPPPSTPPTPHHHRKHHHRHHHHHPHHPPEATLRQRRPLALSVQVHSTRLNTVAAELFTHRAEAGRNSRRSSPSPPRPAQQSVDGRPSSPGCRRT
eukprot:2447445-Pyramimonas_sp.AAC.1